MVRIVLASLAAIVAAWPSASSATAFYADEPPFCEERVLRDYTAPLERMPKLRPLPANGRLGFGPGGLRLTVFRLAPSYFPQFMVGGGEVGYRLGSTSRRPIRLGWSIESSISRVNRRGRVVKALFHGRQRASWVSPKNGIGADLEISAPGLYKVDLVIRNEGGRRLGRFGYYRQVVPLIEDARLVLDRAVYSRGMTVWARTENYGTALAASGVAWHLERLEGGIWALAPENPGNVWILLPLWANSGSTSYRCVARFDIPATTAPGRYRIIKEIEFEIPGKRRPDGGHPVTLYAEFDVVP